MKPFFIILLVTSNLLTAAIISIFHYISDIPSSQKNPRNFELPISIRPPVLLPEKHDLTSYLGTNFNPTMLKLLDDKPPSEIILSNCSLPQKSEDGCPFVQFEALVNLADRTVCKCDQTRFSIGNKCGSPDVKTSEQKVETEELEAVASEGQDGVSIFAITPTYARLTQKVDLTSLCYIIQNVPKIIWIVIEDSSTKTSLVAGVLERCKVQSVHLNCKTSSLYKALKSRGVEQRNQGLSWIREHCKNSKNKSECVKGVMYFMDDDNKYDIRLFEEMKKTKEVSVFPVGFAGGLKFEGPVCQNGSAVKWQAHYAPERVFPMDMAGFAIHITKVLSKPNVKMGFTSVNGKRRPVKSGHLETSYLEQFASKSSVECRSFETEILVWHVKTLKPPLPYEAKHKSDPKVEV